MEDLAEQKHSIYVGELCKQKDRMHEYNHKDT